MKKLSSRSVDLVYIVQEANTWIISRLHQEGDVRIGYMSFANASPFHNPGIIGLDHLREIVVRQNLRWDVAADSSDFSVRQRRSLVEIAVKKLLLSTS